MRNHFRVGLCLENVAFLLQLLFQRKVVLDDAVMHHDQVAGTVAMRMGILFGGASVRRPAGVADAVAAIDGIHLQYVFQVAQLARGASNAKRVVIAVDSDTGRVITPIFQAFETVDDDRDRALRAHVTNNSTHSLQCTRSAAEERAMLISCSKESFGLFWTVWVWARCRMPPLTATAAATRLVILRANAV